MKNLDDLKEILRLDGSDMLDLLVSFPKQCEDALFIGEHAEIIPRYKKKKYSHIVFSGLGGSAIGADTLKGYVGDEIAVPVFVNRNYTLPQFVKDDSLLFAVSYSGNTEETLAAYASAKSRKVNTVVITSGGKLMELALKNKDMLIAIPKGYPPRCALGYSFIPAVMALSKIGFIKNKKDEIRKAAHFLDNLQKEKLAPKVKGRANIAKEIAMKIYGKFPVIYSSEKLSAVITRWRGQIAENAKTLSSTHVFPEMNHNEIVGWVNPEALLKNFIAIMLKDKDDHSWIKKRIEVTTSILRKAKFSVLEVESQGRNFLERMLSLVYIGDFVSFYLSLLNNIDPTPVDRITYLKKQLAK